MDVELEEILSFRKVVAMINDELKSRGIREIEHMLINETIPHVFRVLEKYSLYYQKIKEQESSNGSKFCELLECYFECVKRKYSTMFISDKKTVDKFFELTLGKNKKAISSKQDIGMYALEVERTLALMKEAVYTYYRVYYNRVLNASLDARKHEFSDIEFQIKESELSHLLGISYKKLRDNPDFIRLTGGRKMTSIQLLEWILSDIDGNRDLVQYHEDFIKRMEDNQFSLVGSQFSSETTTSLFNYHKIAMKSQAFMNMGSLDKMVSVARLNPKTRISDRTRSDTIVLGKSGFLNYPWAVLGSVQKRQEDRYTETLSILENERKIELLRKADIVHIDGIEDRNEVIELITEEERFAMFHEAYEAASEIASYERIKAYFKSLYENEINQFVKTK